VLGFFFPLRQIIGGQGGVLQMQMFALFGAKNYRFFKFMVFCGG